MKETADKPLGSIPASGTRGNSAELSQPPRSRARGECAKEGTLLQKDFIYAKNIASDNLVAMVATAWCDPSMASGTRPGWAWEHWLTSGG